MVKPYTITITNGTGAENVINDTYSVTSLVTGYDNDSILPSTLTVESGTTTYPFTIEATGTLTIHVSETGTAEGTAIVGATFIRTDAEGNEYGTAITSDSSGNAVFENVPYAPSEAPNIYYKQTASDGNHNFDNTVRNTTLTTQTGTVEVANTPAVSNTFNVTDANYPGLPINGSLTLS